MSDAHRTGRPYGYINHQVRKPDLHLADNPRPLLSQLAPWQAGAAASGLRVQKVLQNPDSSISALSPGTDFDPVTQKVTLFRARVARPS